MEMDSRGIKRKIELGVQIFVGHVYKSLAVAVIDV